MGSEIESGLEEKFKSLLEQLQAECGVFERIVYKNKNQHRRCSYFQYLLKVRRDLRLLQSAKLDELVASCFHVISGRKPKQKVHLLESLKWGKSHSGVPNFMERLLGVARLLSQMVEPILKAATEVSILLARSFFMEFSLAVLALLARLRVLVQQILLDVVSLSNTVSAISLNKQSVKMNLKGLEVFREYYPTNKEFITLECVWKVDKFVLVERVEKTDVKEDEQSFEVPNDGRMATRYRSIQAFLRAIDGNDDVVENMDEDKPIVECSSPMKKGEDVSAVPSTFNENEHEKQCEPEGSQIGDVLQPGGSPSKGGHVNASSSCSSDAKPLTPNVNSRQVAFVSLKRPAPPTEAAFISVKRPAASVTNVTTAISVSSAATLGHLKGSEKEPDSMEDSFLDFLTSGGHVKTSLF